MWLPNTVLCANFKMCSHLPNGAHNLRLMAEQRTKPVALQKIKNIAWLKDAHGAYSLHRNVLEKEVGRLIETSFSAIRRSADVRQTQENIALRLDDICKTLSPHFNSEIYCSHKWCYRRFTNISWICWKENIRQVSPHRNQLQHLGRQPGVPKRKKVDCYFHRKNAFFCGKGRKKQGSSIEGLAKLLTERAEEAIKEWAREKCDFIMLGKINGENLRAREARFHESCRKSYL